MKIEEAPKQYDQRTDKYPDSRRKTKKYEEMVANEELLDYSKINFKVE